ncbi:MAG: hypothetical protein ACK5LJ_13410 [Paracoccus sp. (in: a-proteobacteria)]
MALANRILWLMLVVSLATLSAARTELGMRGNAMEVEICHEGRVEIVYIDESGRQLPGKPLCDCVGCDHCGLVPVAALPTLPQQMRPAQASRHLAPSLPETLHVQHPALSGQARGPPKVKS